MPPVLFAIIAFILAMAAPALAQQAPAQEAPKSFSDIALQMGDSVCDKVPEKKRLTCHVNFLSLAVLGLNADFAATAERLEFLRSPQFSAAKRAALDLAVAEFRAKAEEMLKKWAV